MAESILKTIREYFGMEGGAFTAQWRKLSKEDREQLRGGFEDGSLNY